MARTISLVPQTITLTNTETGTSVFNTRYDPTLSVTLADGTTETFAEGTASGVFTDSTTGQVYYIHRITDDLVSKYS